MKIDRLLGILAILTQKDRVKAQELADRFEVSLRTVYRDLETIGKAGIPIVTYPGGGGGVGVAPGFKLEKNAFSREDMQNIVLGLKSLESVISGTKISALLAKLSPDPDRFITFSDDILIDLASFYKGSLTPKISLLRKAIAERKTVRFAYFSKTGRTERELEPYFIAFKWAAWYVFGYCRLRQDFRLFKLNRMICPELTESVFEPRKVTEQQLNLEAFYSDPEVKQYADLLLDRSLEYVMVDEYGPESYEIVDEHTIRAKWDYVSEREMVKHILGLGSGVKVIAPPSLAAAVKAEAEKILNRYS